MLASVSLDDPRGEPRRPDPKRGIYTFSVVALLSHANHARARLLLSVTVHLANCECDTR